MKQKTVLLFLLCCLLVSCSYSPPEAPDEPQEPWLEIAPHTVWPEVWILVNTLPYDVYVRPFYQPIDSQEVGDIYTYKRENLMLWLPWRQLIEAHEVAVVQLDGAACILVPSGEEQIISVVVDPDVIALYRNRDGHAQLLTASYGNPLINGVYEIDHPEIGEGNALFLLEGPLACEHGQSNLIIRDDVFLTHTIDWEHYPLGCMFGREIPSPEARSAAHPASGYAVVYHIGINNSYFPEY